nr:HU family DNA-binding protein [Psychromonas sp. SP041]
MNKTQLIADVAIKTGMSKSEIKKALEATLDTITSSLQDGESVQIPSLGTFKVSARAARTGRNPQTGESMNISAKLVPAFKPGKFMKESLNP